ncbi:hypothetical protein OUZ56_020746 [Daphnia magna]|uniref:Uncharacterized protein n=1 Tax=Daphnia magna TaxID=35525 RepID=A0ABQ9ZFI6_9CRUS|nr:hypothetical protein OUZ56_020746 [Daphnia magna]
MFHLSGLGINHACSSAQARSSTSMCDGLLKLDSNLIDTHSSTILLKQPLLQDYRIASKNTKYGILILEIPVIIKGILIISVLKIYRKIVPSPPYPSGCFSTQMLHSREWSNAGLRPYPSDRCRCVRDDLSYEMVVAKAVYNLCATNFVEQAWLKEFGLTPVLVSKDLNITNEMFGLALETEPVWKLLVLSYQLTGGWKSVAPKGSRPWNADESSVRGYHLDSLNWQNILVTEKYL